MKAYKQFVVESNTARDNLYEAGGMIRGTTALIGGSYGLSQLIPWALKKTGLEKPAADLTRKAFDLTKKIPVIGPQIEKNAPAVNNFIKGGGEKENENDQDPKKPRNSAGLPYCDYKTHKYVPSTKECVRK